MTLDNYIVVFNYLYSLFIKETFSDSLFKYINALLQEWKTNAITSGDVISQQEHLKAHKKFVDYIFGE